MHWSQYRPCQPTLHLRGRTKGQGSLTFLGDDTALPPPSTVSQRHQHLRSHRPDSRLLRPEGWTHGGFPAAPPQVTPMHPKSDSHRAEPCHVQTAVSRRLRPGTRPHTTQWERPRAAPRRRVVTPTCVPDTPAVKGSRGAGKRPLQTYLHSPGFSQYPCCSSHPGKQIAAAGRERGVKPGASPQPTAPCEPS